MDKKETSIEKAKKVISLMKGGKKKAKLNQTEACEKVGMSRAQFWRVKERMKMHVPEDAGKKTIVRKRKPGGGRKKHVIPKTSIQFSIPVAYDEALDKLAAREQMTKQDYLRDLVRRIIKEKGVF